MFKEPWQNDNYRMRFYSDIRMEILQWYRSVELEIQWLQVRWHHSSSIPPARPSVYVSVLAFIQLLLSYGCFEQWYISSRQKNQLKIIEMRNANLNTECFPRNKDMAVEWPPNLHRTAWLGDSSCLWLLVKVIMEISLFWRLPGRRQSKRIQAVLWTTTP